MRADKYGTHFLMKLTNRLETVAQEGRALFIFHSDSVVRRRDFVVAAATLPSAPTFYWCAKR